ncbi:hypothetical protein [Micromonospora sp. WMMD737]|uniref:hypothetical protein n=1 Tax=Micromonospora sp. WMMD737 TaxID=3404113 RepID=UPI003B952743
MQVRARLTLSAKFIIDDHWPAPDRCPICQVAFCTARANAVAYLEIVGEPPYVPPVRAAA